MLAVVTIAKIRRKHLGEGKSIRSTARELGISRNTVRKVLRDGKAEHRYDRSDKQPRPKLDGFTQLLETELENNAKRTRRDRLTLREIWRRLCDRGCEAVQNAAAAHALNGPDGGVDYRSDVASAKAPSLRFSSARSRIWTRRRRSFDPCQSTTCLSTARSSLSSFTLYFFLPAISMARIPSVPGRPESFRENYRTVGALLKPPEFPSAPVV
ncbi:MAG: hypothetical protein OXC26_08845 [Albidovulum sp.]|nr:hypothetical protein [Albidovulum sp.]